MDKNEKVMREFSETVEEYSQHVRKLPAAIIRDKARQFVLGSNSSFGKSFKGVYELTKERAPAKGEICSKVEEILTGGGGIKTSVKSRFRAEQVLLKGEAGLFKINKRGAAPVLIDKAGKHFTRSGKNKTRIGDRMIFGINASRAKQRKGEKMLNRQSLAAYFEIRKRESARGYSAMAYLKNAFRNFLGKMRGAEYDAKLINKNTAANTLSSAEARATKSAAYLKIVNFTTGANKAGNRRIVERVLRNVIADMKTYIDRKKMDMHKK